MLTTTLVVQARTGSTRLPGKVLQPIAGRPMLAFLLERLRRAPVDLVVVATSDRPGDDAVAELAGAAGVPVVRGSELDVLARFALAARRHPADAIVRITADCPLTDPAIIGEAVALLDRRGADYASNSLIRTFPVGLDVEVVAADALHAADAEARDAPEREHVTPFVQRHTDRYSLAALRTPERLGHGRWTVDTAEDLERVRKMTERLDDPLRASWHEYLATSPVTDERSWRLVPADLDDAGRIAALTAEARHQSDPRGPLTWRGAPGAAPAVADGFEDAAARLFVLQHRGETCGWLHLAVREAVGTVRALHPRDQGAVVDRALAEVLAPDYQVTSLVDAPADDA